MQTGDHRLLKSINVRLVLNLVRLNKVISSSDLARITGMQPSTIFNILRELTANSHVLNLGKGDSTDRGGKRPYLWSLNKEAAYAIGIDIEIGQLTTVVLDFSSEIVHKKVKKIETSETLTELVRQIVEAVDEIIVESHIDSHKILGVGVAVAGIVDSDAGVVVMTDVLPEVNVPMLEAMKEVFKFPVFVENNANASVVGEKWIGVARDSKNCLNVLVEFDKGVSGLGIGLLLNEELYRGSSYSAGEINIAMPDLHEVLLNVRPHLAEGQVLKKYDASPQELEISTMIDAAKRDDEVAISFFQRLGYQIGKNISRVVAAFNPDMLILSGDVAEVGDLMIAPVKSVIDMDLLSVSSEALKTVTSSQGHYSVAIGAASLVLSDYFKVPNVRLVNGREDLDEVGS
ncbi:MAG TPA: ROK family protein [Candidatus Acidoferrales bacterium]|nr:ROK family protein [Candidatus Acidoferrales bacterium]